MELNAPTGHRCAGPWVLDLRAVSDAGGRLVLPLVRQQLHALLDLLDLLDLLG